MTRSNHRAMMGRRAEVDLAHELEAEGFLVASRRHLGGAGDLLVVRKGDVRLIEVKTTVAGPFANYGPADREALRACAHAAGASPWLAWRVYPSHPFSWFSEPQWPKVRVLA